MAYLSGHTLNQMVTIVFYCEKMNFTYRKQISNYSSKGCDITNFGGC